MKTIPYAKFALQRQPRRFIVRLQLVFFVTTSDLEEFFISTLDFLCLVPLLTSDFLPVDRSLTFLTDSQGTGV